MEQQPCYASEIVIPNLDELRFVSRCWKDDSCVSATAFDMTNAFRSVLINHLETTFENNDSVGLAFIYFNHKEQSYRAVDFLGSLLKHILEKRDELPIQIYDLYKKHQKRSTRPTLHEISQLLQCESQRLEKLFIVLDAFDECPAEDNTPAAILSAIGFLNPAPRILVTTRPHIDLHGQFPEAVHLNITAKEEDIKIYLDGEIDNASTLKQYLDGSLCDAVKEAIVGKANGMYHSSVPQC